MPRKKLIEDEDEYEPEKEAERRIVGSNHKAKKKLRIELDELVLLSMFIGYTLYIIAIVEGIVEKLVLLSWMFSVIGFAIYILVMREREK